jgi:hypothetical protein
MTAEIAIDRARWEQQDRYLWVGHLDGMPLGTIERGRRFTFIGADGVVRSGFRTLDAAQQAHTTRTPTVPVDRDRSGVLVPLVIAAVVFAAAFVALLVAALPSLL